MWIARFSRPESIYDDAAAAQTFSVGKMIGISEAKKAFSKMKKRRLPERKNDFDHIPGFSEFLQGIQRDVNKVNLLKKIRKPNHR